MSKKTTQKNKVEEIIEELKKNKDFVGKEPIYNFFETICAGDNCATRLSSDGEKWLREKLTTLISQIEQEKEREFIDLVNNTSDFADSGDTLKQRIINQLNKQNNE